MNCIKAQYFPNRNDFVAKLSMLKILIGGSTEIITGDYGDTGPFHYNVLQSNILPYHSITMDEIPPRLSQRGGMLSY